MEGVCFSVLHILSFVVFLFLEMKDETNAPK